MHPIWRMQARIQHVINIIHGETGRVQMDCSTDAQRQRLGGWGGLAAIAEGWEWRRYRGTLGEVGGRGRM